MRKYTAGYSYTNSNFVIQNLKDGKVENEMFPLLYVLKNILQRGCPTVMSKFLQEKLGETSSMFPHKKYVFPSIKNNHWVGTIKGDDINGYYPAREFLESIIPNEFGDYSFVQSMIVPEIGINEIVGWENHQFINQQVDFYLPQALLVIEIDGQQHKSCDTQRVSDKIRDSYLKRYGIETVRINTRDLRSPQKIHQILARIAQFSRWINPYKENYESIISGKYNSIFLKNTLLPTAVIRFQILLIELLLNNQIRLGENWRFRVKVCEPDIFTDDSFIRLAIDDLLIWLNHLYQLKEKSTLPKTTFSIEILNPKEFLYSADAINIDFSILKRYTDENTLTPQIIFLRNDFFETEEIGDKSIIGLNKNYFKVCTTASINYNISDKDIPTLEFFLQNIFGKNKFREGQFAIIANALNLRDTIGLLPTGGGKSLCYQLPCLLQPAINFVVCPIKSLMYDQYDNLRKEDVSITNIKYISSDMGASEKKSVMTEYGKGNFLMIWISPERFQLSEFRETISSIANNFNIAYAVIDEVHCLSEWGHDFRTSYLNLAKTIDRLSPKDKYGEGTIKYIGLTATASVNVLKDIKIEFSRRKQQLEEDNIKSPIDFSRKELVFEVVAVEGNNKNNALFQILSKEGIPSATDKATIVFTPTVNGDYGCYPLFKTLNARFPNQVMWYAGQSPKEQGMKLFDNVVLNRIKQETHTAFKEDKYQILCATKAFGMGIDKENIFYTIHYGIPGSIESLYQEAGRAGRWDKNLIENKDKKGKCYVLYSPVAQQFKKDEDDILAPTSSITQMQSIRRKVGSAGYDTFIHLFLFLRNHLEIGLEYHILLSIVNTFFQANTTKIIYYNQVSLFFQPFRPQLGISGKEDEYDLFEKEIYRLCLLGIVEDWARDYQNYFSVRFSTKTDEHIIESLKAYISKYDTEEDILYQVKSVSQAQCKTLFEKSIWFLLDWVFRYITNNRKQSLKGLIELCRNFTTSDEFKQRLDSYFVFNESTFILQHVAEHPEDIEKWFETFYSNRKIITDTEFKKLRDRLMRFLESYHASPGLDFISGFVRLYLDDFEDSDGRPRFENSLAYINRISETKKHVLFISLIKKLIHAGDLLEKQKYEVCSSLIKFFPELLIPLAEEFALPHLLNEQISNNISLLKKLNTQLYEEFGRI